jgi:hypothetical protein
MEGTSMDKDDARPQYPKRPHYGVSLGENLSSLFALFDAAKANGLKWPEISLDLKGWPVVLRIAGEKSSQPGTITVTNGVAPTRSLYYVPKEGGPREPQFFGRIHRDGVFKPHGALEMWKVLPIIKLLKDLSTDPAALARAQGGLTGKCCFCKLPLTDEKSVAAGMGETCAKHYGLLDRYRQASLTVVGV